MILLSVQTGVDELVAIGIRCTLLAAPAASSGALKPLQTVVAGDGHLYGVISGVCDLVIRCQNISGSSTAVYLHLGGIETTRCELHPGQTRDISAWSDGIVPLTVGTVVDPDPPAALLSAKLTFATVNVKRLQPSSRDPRISIEHRVSASVRSLVQDDKAPLRFSCAPYNPAAVTLTARSMSHRGGFTATISWRLRDEAGVDYLRERNGLRPMFNRAAAITSAVASVSISSSSGGPSRSAASATPLAQAGGKRRAPAALERSVIDLTAEEGGGAGGGSELHGPTEPVEIDLTQGGDPSITRLARVKLCVNDGAFLLRDALVPDPDGDAGDVVDSRGYDSFVCGLLQIASETLWPSSEGSASAPRAACLWNLRGEPVRTRAAAVAAGTLVVGRGSTERFTEAAAL